MTESTLTTVLADIGTFFSSAIGWMGDVLDTIAGNPILFMLVVSIPVAGIAIGYLSRLIRL